MSRVGREVVAEAKSSCSTSATESPRRAASRAIPAPMTPPPMTRRSTVRPPSDRTVSARVPTAAWRSDTPEDEGSNAARLWVRLVVFVDRGVHVRYRRVERVLAAGLPEQDGLDHLLRALAGLRHDAQDRAVGHAVLRRITDLRYGRLELWVLRRKVLARPLVVRALDHRVIAGVGLPLRLD